MSSSLRLNSVDPPWVSGNVEFWVDEKELKILFRGRCGILEPLHRLYIEGGQFVDARGNLKVVGGIAMWGESRRRDRYMKRRARAAGYGGEATKLDFITILLIFPAFLPVSSPLSLSSSSPGGPQYVRSVS